MSRDKIKALIVFGTRPEAIKMMPLINILKQDVRFDCKVCVTAQHREMLDQVLSLFDIYVDYDLNIMKANQDISDVTTKILLEMKSVLFSCCPDVVLVHGDTTTALASSLAAFYQKIPVAHVEAGLRTGNLFSPWPEEANRKLIGVLSQVHFAPTAQAKNNLINENVSSDSIFVTGNTAVDAVIATSARLKSENGLYKALLEKYEYLNKFSKLVLITGHRRENFGETFENICHAIQNLAEQNKAVAFLYPVHLNPNVQIPVNRILKNISNVFLVEPLSYVDFVYLMNRSYCILTDSGGIQEEAPALNKPVLVMRDLTERLEAIEAGVAKLVGTNKSNIVKEVNQLINDSSVYRQMELSVNPYGDGHASQTIADLLYNYFC